MILLALLELFSLKGAECSFFFMVASFSSFLFCFSRRNLGVDGDFLHIATY